MLYIINILYISTYLYIMHECIHSTYIHAFTHTPILGIRKAIVGFWLKMELGCSDMLFSLCSRGPTSCV